MKKATELLLKVLLDIQTASQMAWEAHKELDKVAEEIREWLAEKEKRPRG